MLRFLLGGGACHVEIRGHGNVHVEVVIRGHG